MHAFITGTLLAVTLITGAPKHYDAPAPVKEKGWKTIFDGKSTKGWHTYGKSTANASWKVVDGALFLDATHKDPSEKGHPGDLVSDKEYENFHLKIDWKISPKGNSGVIFWAQDDTAKYKETWFTGPEMQVLDNDGHSDGKIIKHRAGNLYDLIAGTEGVVKPVGEWNTSEIISNRGKLELLLNGVTVVSTTYGDDNWKQMIAGSKFKTKADFGTIFKGHIVLQDHGNEVWFKNIMIKSL